jgi:hypothetical protein
MADAWAWVHNGEIANCSQYKSNAEFLADRAGGCIVPLRVETAKVRYANELHQALKSMADLAKRLTAFNDARPASLLIADELLKQIERESTEDSTHG